MLPRILTSIRESLRRERAALLALAAVAVVCVAAVGIVAALGDQRRIGIAFSTVAASEEVPVTIRGIALTFDDDADHARVEDRFAIDPSIPGSVRWRGRIMEYVFTERPQPGQYRLTLRPGPLGATGERMGEAFSVAFSVREPGLALITTGSGGQSLSEVRGGRPGRTLVTAGRIRAAAVAPDGASVAVVTVAGDEAGRLVLIDTATGEVRSVVDSAAIDVGGVAWSPDGRAMLVVRREREPDGASSVPRTWLMRLNGEFVALVEPDGTPTMAPSWSPDGQTIAVLAPATGQVLVRNLATGDTRSLGLPRGGGVTWSPDSRLVAFETVPTGLIDGLPPQPVRLLALDGSIDRTIGPVGEIRSLPRFLDDGTLVTVRQAIGAQPGGTELMLEDVDGGQLVDSFPVASPGEFVRDWDLDPVRRLAVFTVQSGTSLALVQLNLATRERSVLPFAGERVAFLP